MLYLENWGAILTEMRDLLDQADQRRLNRTCLEYQVFVVSWASRPGASLG